MFIGAKLGEVTEADPKSEIGGALLVDPAVSEDDKAACVAVAERVTKLLVGGDKYRVCKEESP